jgi:hypothetical protein
MYIIFIRNTCTFILEFISRPYSGLHNNFRKNLGEGKNKNLRKDLCLSRPIFSHMFFTIRSVVAPRLYMVFKQRAVQLYHEEKRKGPENTVINPKLYFSKSGTGQVISSDRTSVIYTGSP